MENGKGKKAKLSVSAVRVTRRVTSDASGVLSFRVTESSDVQIAIVPKDHPGARAKIVKRAGKGRHRTKLRRLLRGRRLPVGGYRVIVVARNREGQRSRPDRGHFRVIHRRRFA